MKIKIKKMRTLTLGLFFKSSFYTVLKLKSRSAKLIIIGHQNGLKPQNNKERINEAFF